MQAPKKKTFDPFFVILAALSMATGAHAQTVFQYNLPASWDGVASTVTDLSAAGNNATLSASPALSSTRPSGVASGTQSLSSAGGGFHTASNRLLSNTLVEASGGYYYEVYFYWDGTATAYTTQKLIDYAGTESLHLQNINTGAGTADLLFGFDDAVEGPTQSINANTWYKVRAFFDTQGNTIDGSGNLAGLATLVVNGVTASASVTKTTQGDNLNRPIGVGTLPSGSGLVNFNGVIYNPNVALGLPPVGHWRLDETSGTVAADSSGYGNDGTYANGPTLGTAGPYPGDIATAVDFDGSNDHVDLGNLDVSGSELTITAWINADNFSGSASRIVAKANGAGLSNNYWSLTTYSSGGNNYLGILLKTDSGGTKFLPSGNSPLEVGKWLHVAAVYNGSTLKLYKNGVEIYSTSVSGNVTSGPAVPVWIGGSPSNEKFFDGLIDDVRLYDRSLSATEVAELYGLVGHWNMDEGSGSTADDATAFGNNATLYGATWTTDCAGKSALAFDGVSDTAASNAAFDPPAAGAVAFWMQASGTPSVRQRIFGVNGNWEARLETTGKISFDLGASPYVGNEPFATEVVDTEDRWYHIVAMFNDTDDSYEVYVNGELQASGISPVNLVSQTAGILSFGTRTGSSENWDGSLRDFRVYNRWLNPTEISGLSGIIAHWNFEEVSGTVAADSSVAGNDGTYVNAPTLSVEGPFFIGTGDAVELDGSTQLIDTGKSLLNSLTEFSMAGWVRADSVDAIQSFFGQNDVIELGIHYNTGQIHFWTSAGGQVNAYNQISLGKWTHIAAVGYGTELRLYVNGQEVVSGGSATSSYGTSNFDFKIGEGVYNSSGDYFDGRVDDVRIYSRVICPEEIRAIYKGGRPAGVRILKWIEVR